jgi:hypothetical protein
MTSGHPRVACAVQRVAGIIQIDADTVRMIRFTGGSPKLPATALYFEALTLNRGVCKPVRREHVPQGAVVRGFV